MGTAWLDEKPTVRLWGRSSTYSIAIMASGWQFPIGPSYRPHEEIITSSCFRKVEVTGGKEQG